jgi:hypothetical protein
MKTKSMLLTMGLLLSFTACRQGAEWKKGILIDEFVYEKTSFPECHSARTAFWSSTHNCRKSIYRPETLG